MPAGSDAFAGIVTSGSGYSITVDNPLVLGGGGLSLTAAGTETITPASSNAPIYFYTASSVSTVSGATLTVNPNMIEVGGALALSPALAIRR